VDTPDFGYPPPAPPAQPPAYYQPPPVPAYQPPAPVFTGQSPASAAEPYAAPAEAYDALPPEDAPVKKSKTWLYVGCGCLVVILLCVVAGLFAFDYMDLYCTAPFDAIFSCP